MARNSRKDAQSPVQSSKDTQQVRAAPSGEEKAATVTKALDAPDTQQPPSIKSLIFNHDLRKAAQLIILAAIYGPVSQLTLSPVYGTAQAGLYHRWGTLATLFAAFLTVVFLRNYFPSQIHNTLASVAFAIPTIQYFLFKLSSNFPAPY